MNQNAQVLQDINLQLSMALPAQNTTAVSAVLDLNSDTPGRSERVEMLLSLPATPSLANGQTITLSVLNSPDNNADFTANPELPNLVVTGANGTGGPAGSLQVKLPITLQRYIQLQAVTSATAGNNTAVNASLALVF